MKNKIKKIVLFLNIGWEATIIHESTNEINWTRTITISEKSINYIRFTVTTIESNSTKQSLQYIFSGIYLVEFEGVTTKLK